MNPEFNTPPRFDDFDRILEIDDTVDDATEIRTVLLERSPRYVEVPA